MLIVERPCASFRSGPRLHMHRKKQADRFTQNRSKTDKTNLQKARSRQPELMQIVMRAGSDGMTLALAGRTMAAKEGFTRTLREQRMNFRQFVDLNSDTFRLQIRGNASKIFVTPEAAARTRQRPDTLMQFQRLRRGGGP